MILEGSTTYDAYQRRCERDYIICGAVLFFGLLLGTLFEDRRYAFTILVYLVLCVVLRQFRNTKYNIYEK